MRIISDEYFGLPILYHVSSLFIFSHLELRYAKADCGFEWCNRLHYIANPTGLSFVIK